MQEYLNQENKKAIKSLQVKQGTSKEGNAYYYISLVLVNGFEKRIYLSNGEDFAFCNAFDTVRFESTESLNSL